MATANLTAGPEQGAENPGTSTRFVGGPPSADNPVMCTLTKHGKDQLDSVLFQAAFDAKNIERLLIEVEDIGEGVGHDTVEAMIEACKAMAQRIGVAADTVRGKIGLSVFGYDRAAEWLLSPAYRDAVASEAKAVAAAGGV